MDAYQTISPVSSDSRRSRKGVWLGIGIGVLLLCLCCLVSAAAIFLLRDQVPAIGNIFYTATPTSTPTPTRTPTPTPTPTPTRTPTPTITPTFAAGDCHSGAQRLEMNSSVTGRINRGSNFYDVIAMYCLWVPQGGRRLEINLTNFTADLDIYVSRSYDELMSPTGMGEWNSRAGGTTPERVVITNPGGRYYIQVVSYTGAASSFTLSNTYTP